ncbi:MAG: hypothetical protein CMJ42_22975, partial [Phyllobacteriaceae bacterium]|nr:hypothetical protein [Phyllobacteriaceae bacterium]
MTILGPIYPAPGGNTFSSDGGNPGRDGGVVFTFDNLNTTDYSNFWWGLTGMGLAMDGTIDQALETLSFDVIIGGQQVAVWVGQTSAPGIAGTVYTRLVATIEGGSGGAVWELASDDGLSGGPGQVIDLDETVTGFSVRIELQASFDSSFSSYDSFLDFYDLFSTGDSGAISEFGGTFFAETSDTTPPAEPTVDPLYSGTDTTPVITGTASTEAGVTTTVSVGGATWTVTPDGAGNWTLDLSTPPDSGTYSPETEGFNDVTVTSTDAAGNTSSDTSSNELEINIMAPSIVSVTSSSPVISEADASTGTITITVVFDQSMNTQPTVTPVISFPDENPSSTISYVSGSWSTTTSANDTYTFTFSVTDANIDLSDIDVEITNARSFTGDNLPDTTVTDVFSIDTLIAEVPAAPDLVAASDSGDSDSDDLTNDNTPTFGVAIPATGLEVGDTVELIDTSNGDAVIATHTINGGELGTTIQLTASTLADGDHTIAVRFTDPAGNTRTGTELTVDVDTTVPSLAAPDLVVASDSGSSDSDNLTNDDTPTFSIDVSGAEAGDVVELLVGGASLSPAVTYTVTGSETGPVELTAGTLSGDASYDFTVQITDAAGNSFTSPATTITLDTVAPAAPTVVLADDTTNGEAGNDGDLVTSNGTLTVTPAEGDGIVQFSTDGGSTWSTDAPTYASDGSDDGSHTVLVRQVDEAGNEGASTSITFTLDTTAPDAPVITGTTHDTDDTGINDATPTISGTGEAGATVTVTVNDGSSDIATLTAVVDEFGNWSVTPATPLVTETGTHTLTFTATQTDIAGNASGPSVPVSVNLDFSPEVLGYVDNSNTFTGDAVNDGTGSVVENADGAPGENTGFITTTGDILFEDLPTGQTYTVSVSPGAGAVGLFQAGISDDTLADTNGAVTWTYQYSASAADQLGEGDTITSTFNVTITDSNGDSTTETITVTIVGTNDAPVIEVVGTDSESASHTEDDAGFTASGTLSVSDVDTSDVVNASVTGVAASGTGADDLPVGLDNAALLSLLTVGANPVIAGGSTSGTIDWSFDSGGEAFDFLNDGDVLVLTYTIQVADDSGAGNATDTQTITITITGTNDAAVVTGTSTGAVTEDAGTPATGDLDHTDADSDDTDDAWNTTVVTQGTYGTLTMNADGTWSYVLDD